MFDLVRNAKPGTNPAAYFYAEQTISTSSAVQEDGYHFQHPKLVLYSLAG